MPPTRILYTKHMDTYSQFLEPKGKDDIWRKAKQIELSSLDQLLLVLENNNILTMRNAMTLRILGLVDKAEETVGGEVALTSAGEELLANPNKQQIIDEQLLKMYLDSYVNSHLSIPVFPVAIIYELLAEFDWVSFAEYALFVCWINNDEDKQTVKELLRRYRACNQSEQQEMQQMLKVKTTTLGYQDFNDHISRLFNMFKLSGYIDVEMPEGRWSDVLHANSNKDVYEQLVASLRRIDMTDYEMVLTTVLGVVEVSPSYNDITSQLQGLSLDDRKIIKQQLRERTILPDIAQVHPRAVQVEIVDHQDRQPKQATRTAPPKKIDYEKRTKRNRLVGAYGEKLIVKYEYTKLIEVGRADLAEKIDHCSLYDDSLGYDIASYSDSGEEKHIEVKTVTGKPKSLRFYISKNELDQAQQDPHHCIYIVFHYDTLAPEIWELGNIAAIVATDTVAITPTTFTVDVNVEYSHQASV